jgi:Kef-type K+ transport system membrane component KefB
MLAIVLSLANLFNSAIIGAIGALTYFMYIIWAIGQFFGEKKIMNYVKSALTYFLGNMSYLIVLIVIAYFLKRII